MAAQMLVAARSHLHNSESCYDPDSANYMRDFEPALHMWHVKQMNALT